MRSSSWFPLVVLVISSCQAPLTSKKGATVGRTTPVSQYGAEFWDTWSDGFAEVSTYDLIIPRYGEARNGESILIFVSETFSERQRVKAEPGNTPKPDQFPVMKVNWQKNYQTGVYDYSEMLSAFLGLGPSGGRPEGRLAKLSFTRQEWSGHLFSQALFATDSIRISGASYLDGEADLSQKLEWQPETMSEDGLVFWARQMSPPYLQPGDSKAVPFLTGLRSARDAHAPLAYSRINLTRAPTAQKVEVPAGEFEVEVWAAQLPNGKGYLFQVEKDAPHRLLRWQFTTGEVGELVASERIKYWQLNQPEGVEALKGLGLDPRAPRFAPDDEN